MRKDPSPATERQTSPGHCVRRALKSTGAELDWQLQGAPCDSSRDETQDASGVKHSQASRFTFGVSFVSSTLSSCVWPNARAMCALVVERGNDHFSSASQSESGGFPSTRFSHVWGQVGLASHSMRHSLRCCVVACASGVQNASLFCRAARPNSQ